MQVTPRAPPPGFAQPKAEQPSQGNPDKSKLRQEACQAEPPMAPQLPKGRDNQASTISSKTATSAEQASPSQPTIPSSGNISAYAKVSHCKSYTSLHQHGFVLGTCWCAYPEQMRMP